MRFGRIRCKDAKERYHPDDDATVVVIKRWQGAANQDGATEFLTNFPHDGGIGVFARLDFAAGEFPFEREEFVGRTLRDEDAAIAFDDGADDWHRGIHETDENRKAVQHNLVNTTGAPLRVGCWAK